MPASQLTIQMLDNSNKTQGFGMHIPTLDASNIVDYTDHVNTGTLLNDLLLAIDGCCGSAIWSINVQAASIGLAPSAPADLNAQNETVLLLKYVDTVEPSLKGRIAVKGADREIVGQAGTDAVSLADTQVAALVAAVEAMATSKIGNPITIYEAVLTVG